MAKSKAGCLLNVNITVSVCLSCEDLNYSFSPLYAFPFSVGHGLNSSSHHVPRYFPACLANAVSELLYSGWHGVVHFAVYSAVVLPP